MRSILLAAVTAALVAIAAAPAAAHPGVALEPTLPDDLTYSATDNVEYLGRFPEHTGTADSAGVPALDPHRGSVGGAGTGPGGAR